MSITNQVPLAKAETTKKLLSPGLQGIGGLNGWFQVRIADVEGGNCVRRWCKSGETGFEVWEDSNDQHPLLCFWWQDGPGHRHYRTCCPYHVATKSLSVDLQSDYPCLEATLTYYCWKGYKEDFTFQLRTYPREADRDRETRIIKVNIFADMFAAHFQAATTKKIQYGELPELRYQKRGVGRFFRR